uniref:RNA-directed DNA polymerase, eukaryota, reverse transcriptase zinc-binding domain protein n=1 Tax=Tanacetum cinerariifolium TaxID=118510 RepID=A0A6L2MAE4_TANCI|nr:hypothetical protein [Tanacetum cinerariifolium]
MLKCLLRRLACKNGNLQDRVEKCRDKLKRAQVLRENNPYDDQLKEEGANCLSLYLEAVGDEENFMIANMNKITSICNEKSEKFERNDVEKQFVSNFKRFLEAENECDDLDVRNLFQKKISHDDADDMVKEITDNKIKESMFDIGDNKAPRVDGFTSTFFKKKVEERDVLKFDKGYKEMKLTHLSFADDLLVFYHGDVNSINVIIDALLEFSKVSSLLPNMDKSVIFFGSVKENVKHKILQTLPFKVGKLPVNNASLLGSYGKSKVSWKIACKPKCEGGLGNGRDIAMWSDNWCTIGYLSQYISNRMLFDARIKEICALLNMIHNGSWNWLEEWLQQVPILVNIHVPRLNEHDNDYVKWRNNKGKLIKFNIKNAWWDLRDKMDSLKW